MVEIKHLLSVDELEAVDFSLNRVIDVWLNQKRERDIVFWVLYELKEYTNKKLARCPKRPSLIFPISQAIVFTGVFSTIDHILPEWERNVVRQIVRENDRLLADLKAQNYR